VRGQPGGRRVDLPAPCVVALVGASGSGKSTFALTHFRPTEVLSSDFFRGLVADDESDQRATRAAFDCLYYVAARRLAAGRLTVIDATNLRRHAREAVLRLARSAGCPAAALVLDLPEDLCLAQNRARNGRVVDEAVVRAHCAELRRGVTEAGLLKEGFGYVYVFSGAEDLLNVVITRGAGAAAAGDAPDQPASAAGRARR